MIYFSVLGKLKTQFYIHIKTTPNSWALKKKTYIGHQKNNPYST